MKSEVTTCDNWIMDHIVANKGTLNYCVRWDSKKTKLAKATAAKFQAMLTRQHAAWNHWLIGYDCWPYNEIKVNIVGWAAREASDLGWSDDSLGKLYIGDLDKDGAPQCPENCYRWVDGTPGGWSPSSGCDGKPFDVSLWPTQDLGGGWGTYWGQQVDLDNMLAHIDDEELTIVTHEMGHGFGLPDFYHEPKPPNFKPCLMDALTCSSIRDTDGWMLRRVLENKKPKYNF
ncbi:neutral zinc metallopeptidase, Zn-binding site [Phytophthora cinnamomi]|nr:neutral zinc metallopeptidase, Zn-binding site [Phytophthora cinnamomi]